MNVSSLLLFDNMHDVRLGDIMAYCMECSCLNKGEYWIGNRFLFLVEKYIVGPFISTRDTLSIIAYHYMNLLKSLDDSFKKIFANVSVYEKFLFNLNDKL